MKSLLSFFAILTFCFFLAPQQATAQSTDCISILEATSSHDLVVCEGTMVEACASIAFNPPVTGCCDLVLTVTRWEWQIGPVVPVDVKTTTIEVCEPGIIDLCLTFEVDCLPFANIPSWFSFEVSSDCCEGEIATVNYIPVNRWFCDCPEACCDYNLVSDDGLATIDGDPLCSGQDPKTICPGHHTVCYTVFNTSECKAREVTLQIDAEIIFPGTPTTIVLPGSPQTKTIPPGGSVVICQDFDVPDPGVQAGIRFPITLNDSECDITDLLLSRCGVRLLPCSHNTCAGTAPCVGSLSFPASGILQSASSPENATAHPNPFKDEVLIKFKASGTSNPIISIFDMHGRLVETIHQQDGGTGFQQVRWLPGPDIRSGLYLINIQEGASDQTIKVFKE